MSTISIDRDGLSIDGTRLFLLAGVIHYFRYPKAEWRDILLKARAGGVNTIDTVIPWNLHEPEEGHFNFAEEADLAAYLDLCAELGLYAIVRPGPYICAEWENGGIPAWLSVRTSDLRVDDPAYLEATLRWFDRLLALIVPRQITHAGSVILCQIENEHWASGRYGNDTHQATLARAAEERGILVPQYTCMGAMTGRPEFRNGWNNIGEKLRQTRSVWPENPMIVSELWNGWFDSWGATAHRHKTPASLDRILHQLTATGASGLSHWVLAGGTNFGFWGGRTVGGDAIHMTTSYDYDAPISEYGGLRKKYFVARRHHLFLSTLGSALAPILADGLSGGPQVIGQTAVPGRSAGGGGVYRSVRAAADSPAAWRDFSAVFLDNPAPDGLSLQVFLSNPAVHLTIDVEADALRPVFANLPLGNNGLRLDFCTFRVLGFWPGQQQAVLVLYGAEGESGEVQLSAPDRTLHLADQSTAIQVQRPAGTQERTAVRLRSWIASRPAVLRMAGEQPVTIVLLSQTQAERWWPLSDGSFICGPHLVVEDGSNVRVDLRGEQPFFRLDASGALAPYATASETPAPLEAPASAVAKATGAWSSEPGAVRPAAQGTTALASAEPVGISGPVASTAEPTGAWSSEAGAVRPPANVTTSQDRAITPVNRGREHGWPPFVWQRVAVRERGSTPNDESRWRTIDRPQSLEELGCPLGYGWYRAVFTLDSDRETTLVAPALNDRARVLLDGNDIGWLGIHPWGSRYTLPLRLTAETHDLRLCVDNLGRFNYGSNLGERKGLCDTLYLDGQQHDLSGGWTALWQEAVFAGEALAHAHPAAVRPDAANVDLGNFAFQGPSVWLLRTFEAREGWQYLLQLTGDRNPGALFVNGVAVERFSRHKSGGLISSRLEGIVRPGTNVIALNIQGYAGAAWRASLLEFDPAQALSAQWSFCPGVSSAEAQNGSGMAFWRAEFAYDASTYGAGPFRLGLHGLSKGQLWLNGHNLGRYWQIGPQEYYKLPVSWLQARNELLVFDEEGASPSGVRVSTDELGANWCIR